MVTPPPLTFFLKLGFDVIFAEAVLILSKTSVGELWKSRYKARERGEGEGGAHSRARLKRGGVTMGEVSLYNIRH